MTRRVLVIGHGIAGLTAAGAARGQDGESRVLLFGDEPYDAYYRVRLSHDLATGIEVDKIRLRPQGWYDANGIAVRRGVAVTELDVAGRTARLADGSAVGFDVCILATGSRSFIPPIEGSGRPGVSALRSAADAMAIRARAVEAGAAAVAGGGLLGLEVAYGLASVVPKVIVLERGGSLLRRQLDREGGEMLASALARSGIEVLTGTEVAAALSKAGSAPAAEPPEMPLRAIQLKDGRQLPCDLLVVAAGVRPRLELAQAAGLKTDRGGVVVDDRMATSDPAVFACGDVASHHSGNYAIWPQAMAQGKIAGINAAGGQVAYAPVVPENLLQVAGMSVFAVGEAGDLGEAPAPGTVEVSRRDDSKGRYAKFRLREDVLVGAMLIGEDRLARAARPAVEERRRFGFVASLPEGKRFAALAAVLEGGGSDA